MNYLSRCCCWTLERNSRLVRISLLPLGVACGLVICLSNVVSGWADYAKDVWRGPNGN